MSSWAFWNHEVFDLLISIVLSGKNVWSMLESQKHRSFWQGLSGAGKCPMTWVYWTSPTIVAIKKTIYLMGDVKHGDMTNDPCLSMFVSLRVCHRGGNCRWMMWFPSSRPWTSQPAKLGCSIQDSVVTTVKSTVLVHMFTNIRVSDVLMYWCNYCVSPFLWDYKHLKTI